MPRASVRTFNDAAALPDGAHAAWIADESPLLLTVGTFNLRGVGLDGTVPERQWPVRLPKIAEQIAESGAWVVGCQESTMGVYPAGVVSQGRMVSDHLNATGRGVWACVDGDNEKSIIYRADRLLLLSAVQSFPLNVTIVGTGARRTANWVEFQDRATGHRFLFFNTHFPTSGETPSGYTHTQMAEEGGDRVGDTAATLTGSRGIPAVIVGDFNHISAPQERIVVKGFPDTITVGLPPRDAALNSVNGFDPTMAGRLDAMRIDRIFASPVAEPLEVALIVRYSDGLSVLPLAVPIASDHFMLTARLRFP